MEVEESAVETVASRSPCIVIVGQSTQICADIANWLLGSDILPKPGHAPWRTIHFRYGQKNRVGLLGDSENIKSVASHEIPLSACKQSRSWKAGVLLMDIEIVEGETDQRPLDVRANLPLLASGARITVVGSSCNSLIESYDCCTSDVIPIVVYAFQTDILNDEELKLLQHIHKSDASLPVYFVKMPNAPAEMLADACRNGNSSPQLYRQLREFFSDTASQSSDLALSRPPSESRHSLSETAVVPETSATDKSKPMFLTLSDSLDDGGGGGGGTQEVCEADATVKIDLTGGTVELVNFADVQQTPIDAKSISLSNDDEIPTMISQVVDRPVTDADCESSVATVECEIVEGLYDGFSSGLATFVRSILQSRLLSAVALLHAVHRRCLELMISSAYDMQWDTICTPTRLKFARDKETELYHQLVRVTIRKQDEIKQIIQDAVASEAEKIITNAGNLDLTGDVSSSADTPLAQSAKNVKECTAQIHEFVLSQLNAAISCKLLQLIDVYNDSYTGVLTRCLASLEQKDLDSSRSTGTSDALKEILEAAYHVEISVFTGASFVKTLFEKMKQLMHGSLWRTPASLDEAWKRKTAASLLASLTEARCQRLAKSICAQIKERVRSSHTCFQTSLQRLEAHHNGRLKQTEQQSLNVRKNYAPRIARLALESRSLRDLIVHGKPELGREIGRGQYGVVYSCETWAGFSRCAVKSVVPPDERHWNDLAMEFHYTTNIPEHSRIVSLRGSIIDYSFGSGRTPAVLLVMDRYKYDLYTAIERRMNWLSRLQVAIDVVEGIRYLHAQGLVHRDVKLKNVLLDDDSRGRLTDLGFCKPEAMMSGSIVGTPLHMAPELITGRYDHSVDVYAFGVLFWYVCAGSVRLPSHFEVCANKEMLFTLVQQGLRPERPQDCDAECWELMRRCWNGDASLRPHVGELEDCLKSIFDRFLALRQQSIANGDVTDDLTTDSMNTDSDFDYDDLTLK